MNKVLIIDAEEQVRMALRNKFPADKYETFECVKDWNKSPFCIVNPYRQAFVGRDVLLEFPAEVRLDCKI